MAQRNSLGKGLSSLIPPSDAAPSSSADGTEAYLREIPTTQIVPNPHQPRRRFDEESLAELTASIQHLGVLQPILVRQVGDQYELIAGERRWRAARRAGLSTITAVIRVTDDLASVEQALVENLHRQDLTVLEEAAAYQQLIEDFHLTHEDLAERVGKSRSAITNTLRLLGLPPSIQGLLNDERLSAGHARALLGVADRSLQEQLAHRSVEEGWSVRSIESEIRRQLAPAPEADESRSRTRPEPIADGAGLTPATRLRPPGLLELEERLADHLQTRVSVQMAAKKGRVTIEFADLSDLERIYRLMAGT